MTDTRNKNEQTNRQAMLFEDLSPMTHSEMRSTFGGARGTLYDEWKALCAKYPDSAPCKGRH